MILRGNDATFNRELQPLSGLDTIGDGFSFVVKRSAKWEEQIDKKNQIQAYKISKANLSSKSSTGDRTLESFRYRALLTESQVLSHPPLQAHANVVAPKGIMWTPDLIEPRLITAALKLEFADHSTLTELQAYRSLEFPMKKKLCLDFQGSRSAIVHQRFISHFLQIISILQISILLGCSFGGCLRMAWTLSLPSTVGYREVFPKTFFFQIFFSKFFFSNFFHFQNLKPYEMPMICML